MTAPAGISQYIKTEGLVALRRLLVCKNRTETRVTTSSSTDNTAKTSSQVFNLAKVSTLQSALVSGTGSYFNKLYHSANTLPTRRSESWTT